MKVLQYLTALLLLMAGSAQAELVVFAAASLRGPLDEVAAAHEARTGEAVLIAYGPSSTLARQIQAGAPADLFISAAPDWMDAVAERLIEGSRVDLLGNQLVVIAPARGDAPAHIDVQDLPTALGEGPLAVALTEAVPAGRYTREALETLGLWPVLRDHLAEAADVRGALALVAHHAAPFGIVYASDARAEPRVVAVSQIPRAAHRPIIYPAALIKGSAPSAAALLDDIIAARPLFYEAGFLPPPPQP